ncbi:MAG TPA: hypothetical protein VFM61_03155 [Pseudidiomarina sp.]|nr:hypothetical protein [Pseudidiomarina sp.]
MTCFAHLAALVFYIALSYGLWSAASQTVEQSVPATTDPGIESTTEQPVINPLQSADSQHSLTQLHELLAELRRVRDELQASSEHANIDVAAFTTMTNDQRRELLQDELAQGKAVPKSAMHYLLGYDTTFAELYAPDSRFADWDFEAEQTEVAAMLAEPLAAKTFERISCLKMTCNIHFGTSNPSEKSAIVSTFRNTISNQPAAGRQRWIHHKYDSSEVHISFGRSLDN